MRKPGRARQELGYWNIQSSLSNVSAAHSTYQGLREKADLICRYDLQRHTSTTILFLSCHRLYTSTAGFIAPNWLLMTLAFRPHSQTIHCSATNLSNASIALPWFSGCVLISVNTLNRPNACITSPPYHRHSLWCPAIAIQLSCLPCVLLNRLLMY